MRAAVAPLPGALFSQLCEAVSAGLLEICPAPPPKADSYDSFHTLPGGTPLGGLHPGVGGDVKIEDL